MEEARMSISEITKLGLYPTMTLLLAITFSGLVLHALLKIGMSVIRSNLVLLRNYCSCFCILFNE